MHIQDTIVGSHSPDIIITYDGSHLMTSNINLDPFLYIFSIGRFKPSAVIMCLMQKLVYDLTSISSSEDELYPYLLKSNSLLDLLSHLEVDICSFVWFDYILEMNNKPMAHLSQKITIESKISVESDLMNNDFSCIFSTLLQIMLLSESVNYLILDETHILRHLDLHTLIDNVTHITCSYDNKTNFISTISNMNYSRLFTLEDFHRSNWCKGVQKVLNNLENLPHPCNNQRGIFHIRSIPPNMLQCTSNGCI